jgi:hypothetical protein
MLESRMPPVLCRYDQLSVQYRLAGGRSPILNLILKNYEVMKITIGIFKMEVDARVIETLILIMASLL